MSGIIGSKFNHRGSGLVGSVGTDGQHLLSSGAGKKHVFETVAASSYDDEAIKSDLTALALREATNESSAAFNLPGSFIETFTDDTNLGTQTTGDRVSGYWATVYSAVGQFTSDSNTMLLLHFDGANDATSTSDSSSKSQTVTFNSNAHLDTGVKKFGASSAQFAGGTDHVKVAASSDFAYTGDFTIEFWVYPTSLTAQYEAYVWHSTGIDAAGEIYLSKYYYSGASPIPAAYPSLELFNNSTTQTWSTNNSTTSGGLLEFDAWNHLALTRDGSVGRWYRNGVQLQTLGGGTTTLSGTYGSATPHMYIGGDNAEHSSAQPMTGYIDEFRVSDNCRYPDGTTFTPSLTSAASATGTLIQSANSVTGTRTSVGGTILYADEDGTASLGTDLKIYFTANGGSNWTETTGYNAITPVYASGIKQVRLDKTTVTGGTDVRYKAVWANQSAGSKETQLHGIGINY